MKLGAAGLFTVVLLVFPGCGGAQPSQGQSAKDFKKKLETVRQSTKPEGEKAENIESLRADNKALREELDAAAKERQALSDQKQALARDNARLDAENEALMKKMKAAEAESEQKIKSEMDRRMAAERRLARFITAVNVLLAVIVAAVLCILMSHKGRLKQIGDWVQAKPWGRPVIVGGSVVFVLWEIGSWTFLLSGALVSWL